MDLKSDKKQNVTILRLKEKRIDSKLSSDLKAHLLYLAKENVENVLIDMASVEYVDSSGLGAILFGVRQYRAIQGKLKIANVQPRVLSLIRIAKLENVIESYDNEEEAVASFESA